MARTDKKVGYSPTGKLEDVTPDMAATGVEAAFRMLEGRWKMVIVFQLFDRDQQFILHDDLAGGLRVELSIPFRLMRNEA